MGSISNSSSLRANISLRSPYNAYFFQPFSVQINFFIYSAYKAYSRIIRNKEFSKKYHKNLDGFNFSFTNSGKFCFSVRVFDKPVFFPGFFKSLFFKPKVRKYFGFSSIIIKNSNFFSVKSEFFKFHSKYRLFKGKLVLKFSKSRKFYNKGLVGKFKYKNFPRVENKYKNFSRSRNTHGFSKSNLRKPVFRAELRRIGIIGGIKFFFSRVKEFFFLSRFVFIFRKFKNIFFTFLSLNKLKLVEQQELKMWCKRYSQIFKKFFFFIVFNAPIMFIRGILIKKFFFFFKVVNKFFNRVCLVFSYRFKKLIYNLSNYLFFSYKYYVRLKMWRSLFAGRLACSFSHVIWFNKFRFDFCTNNKMFVPNQLKPIIYSTLRQKSKKKARGVVYGVYNKINRFLFYKSRKKFKKFKSFTRFKKDEVRIRGRRMPYDQFFKHSVIGLIFREFVKH